MSDLSGGYGWIHGYARTPDVTGRELRKIDLRELSDELKRRTCEIWIGEQCIGGRIDPKQTLPFSLGNGLYTRPVTPANPPWPVPVSNTSFALELVIRECVEGDPDPKLIDLLDQRPNWKEAVQEAEAYTLSSRPFGWLPLDNEVCQFILFHHGLPANPSTARYLLFRVAPDVW
jgi:hypothetical protein